MKTSFDYCPSGTPPKTPKVTVEQQVEFTKSGLDAGIPSDGAESDPNEEDETDTEEY